MLEGFRQRDDELWRIDCAWESSGRISYENTFMVASASHRTQGTGMNHQVYNLQLIVYVVVSKFGQVRSLYIVPDHSAV